MDNIRDLLGDLVRTEGINTAVVVSRDGFVIEGVSTGDVDTEGVGAVVASGIGAAEVMGRELMTGEMTQGMLEYKNGVIVMSTLGMDAILAVVADLSAKLGSVRYQVKKSMPKLLDVL